MAAYAEDESRAQPLAPVERTVETSEGEIKLSIRPDAYDRPPAGSGGKQLKELCRMAVRGDSKDEPRPGYDPPGALAQFLVDTLNGWDVTEQGQPSPVEYEKLKALASESWQGFYFLYVVAFHVADSLELNPVTSFHLAELLRLIRLAIGDAMVKTVEHLPASDMRRAAVHLKVRLIVNRGEGITVSELQKKVIEENIKREAGPQPG